MDLDTDRISLQIYPYAGNKHLHSDAHSPCISLDKALAIGARLAAHMQHQRTSVLVAKEGKSKQLFLRMASVVYALGRIVSRWTYTDQVPLAPPYQHACEYLDYCPANPAAICGQLSRSRQTLRPCI